MLPGPRDREEPIGHSVRLAFAMNERENVDFRLQLNLMSLLAARPCCRTFRGPTG